MPELTAKVWILLSYSVYAHPAYSLYVNRCCQSPDSVPIYNPLSAWLWQTVRLAGLPHPESIEWFIENQAFLRSYDSAPRPPPLPSPSLVSKLSLFLSLSVCRRSGEVGSGRGGGLEAKAYDREKTWPSINHSIVSVTTPHTGEQSG